MIYEKVGLCLSVFPFMSLFPSCNSMERQVDAILTSNNILERGLTMVLWRKNGRIEPVSAQFLIFQVEY